MTSNSKVNRVKEMMNVLAEAQIQMLVIKVKTLQDKIIQLQ